MCINKLDTQKWKNPKTGKYLVTRFKSVTDDMRVTDRLCYVIYVFVASVLCHILYRKEICRRAISSQRLTLKMP